MKKIPMRKCIVSGESFPKKELLRIVRTPEGELKIDPSGKINGKGAYIKKDIKMVEGLKTKKILKRLLQLDTDIKDDFYQELIDVINAE